MKTLELVLRIMLQTVVLALLLFGVVQYCTGCALIEKMDAEEKKKIAGAVYEHVVDRIDAKAAATPVEE